MNRSLGLAALVTAVALLLWFPVDAPAATKKKKSTDTSDDTSASTPSPSATPAPKKPDDSDASSSKGKGEHAPDATVEPEQIAEFAAQPPRIQQLIRDAVNLTRLNLTYAFGSSDPDSGGMDCSGTIYYLLRAHDFHDVPRDSGGQYMWARKAGGFFPVVSKSAESAEFKELLPGDLMFWTGTYESGRDIPISHVMMYLGREKGGGKRIMFGASDGRSYNGIQRWGVSVFDFKMPKADPANPEKAKVDFVGFARIPGLRSPAPVVDEDMADGAKKDSATATKKAAASPTPASTPAHKKKKKVSSDD